MKEGKLYYKISEVSEHLGLTTSLLRFWETEFKQIAPKKNAKGERIYTQKDIETIATVKYLLKEKGYTIPGAKEAIENDKKVQNEMEVIEKLEALKAFLLEVKSKLD